MGSPISSWEGVQAYFTSASSPGLLMFWVALVAVAVIGAVVHTVMHEEKAVVAVRNGERG